MTGLVETAMTRGLGVGMLIFGFWLLALLALF